MSRRKKGSRSRKRLGAKRPPVVLGDWLAKKPYKTPTKHDYYYLKLCNEVYAILNQPKLELKLFGLNRQNITELAVVVASYIEDFASEIGIWKAFTDYNKEKFGYPLPFFDIENEEYFENDLNPQDIAYICWHYACICREDDGFFAPHYFSEIGNAIFNLIEPKIEELSATAFYDNYFKIEKDYNFFDLKTIFKWFALDSYLIGVEFQKDLDSHQEEIGELVREKIEEAETYEEALMIQENYNSLLYASLNDYFYHKNSKYGAMNVPIWLSKIIQGTESVKQQIADFHKYKKGQFEFKAIEENHYVFEEDRTGKIFKVIKESFGPGFERDQKIGHHAEMALFYWNTDWHLSGALMGNDNRFKFDLSKPIPFYLYTEELQKSVIEQQQDNYDTFVKVHDSPFVICEDKEDLHRVIDTYQDKYFKDYIQPRNPELTELPEKSRMRFDNLENEHDLSVFFSKYSGVLVLYFIKSIIHIIHKDISQITEEEIHEVFNQIYFDPYDDDVIKYLLKKYPQIKEIIPSNIKIDLKKHGESLLYFNAPETYKHTPQYLTSVMNSDKIKLYKDQF